MSEYTFDPRNFDPPLGPALAPKYVYDRSKIEAFQTKQGTFGVVLFILWGGTDGMWEQELYCRQDLTKAQADSIVRRFCATRTRTPGFWVREK
jgi:hypothetical protein